MKTKKGFTLAEMVAVIAIMMFLALLSTPYVKGYIDDSYNGKAIAHMRQINEARKNFEKDYPGTKIGGGETLTSCDLERIYNSTGLVLEIPVLVACNYLQEEADLEGRYSFQAGDKAECVACDKAGVKAVVSMDGLDGAGIYKDKCACMDSLNRVYKEE